MSTNVVLYILRDTQELSVGTTFFQQRRGAGGHGQRIKGYEYAQKLTADNARLMRELSRDEWRTTLDKCGVQSITLTGGEPILHPDFMEIMREIHRRGMMVRHINTNGAFITHEMLEEFRTMGAGPLIKISFDCLGHLKAGPITTALWWAAVTGSGQMPPCAGATGA